MIENLESLRGEVGVGIVRTAGVCVAYTLRGGDATNEEDGALVFGATTYDSDLFADERVRVDDDGD